MQIIIYRDKKYFPHRFYYYTGNSKHNYTFTTMPCLFYSLIMRVFARVRMCTYECKYIRVCFMQAKEKIKFVNICINRFTISYTVLLFCTHSRLHIDDYVPTTNYPARV